jgi:hypothetical protein
MQRSKPNLAITANLNAAASANNKEITADLVAAASSDNNVDLGNLVNTAMDVATTNSGIAGTDETTLAAKSITTIPRMPHPMVEMTPSYFEDIFRRLSNQMAATNRQLSDQMAATSDGLKHLNDQMAANSDRLEHRIELLEHCQANNLTSITNTLVEKVLTEAIPRATQAVNKHIATMADNVIKESLDGIIDTKLDGFTSGLNHCIGLVTAFRTVSLTKEVSLRRRWMELLTQN